MLIYMITTMFAIAIYLFSSWLRAVENSQVLQQSVNLQRILIVYLSRTNNTKAVIENYSKNYWWWFGSNWIKNVVSCYREIVVKVVTVNEIGYLPPLKTKINSIGKYDVVFVDSQHWVCSCLHSWKVVYFNMIWWKNCYFI